MDIIAFVFLLFLAAMAVTAVNARALLGREVDAERFVRHGIWHPKDAPETDAPPEFIDRVHRRERAALFGSAGTALAGVWVAALLEDMSNAVIVLFTMTFLGRLTTLAVFSMREVFRFRDGPRLSRGRRASLAARRAPRFMRAGCCGACIGGGACWESTPGSVAARAGMG